MTETIEIDDVHEFMLDKLSGDDADPEDIVETLIYQAHQVQKQQEQSSEIVDKDNEDEQSE